MYPLIPPTTGLGGGLQLTVKGEGGPELENVITTGPGAEGITVQIQKKQCLLYCLHNANKRSKDHTPRAPVRPQKRKHTKTKTPDRLHICAGEDRVSRWVVTCNINERCIGRTYKDLVGGERYVHCTRCILGSV